jgi:hypothetical protein
MEAAALVLDALGRVREMVRGALKDLAPEELLASPKPHIAWLVWHLSRVQDANFSGLMERPQLWIADGWHTRFNMPPDPKDYGSGTLLHGWCLAGRTTDDSFSCGFRFAEAAGEGEIPSDPEPLEFKETQDLALADSIPFSGALMPLV